ncbi:MAG: hypothetical protein IPK13_03725 [Deltaproteobacteria bacterium]|nr:hypothetical protein [Deltaproteobacteria bacterium]
MTNLRLQETIHRATHNDVPSCLGSAVVDGEEAQAIIEAAEGGGRPSGKPAVKPLSRADREAVVDLFDRQPPTRPAGAIVTMACPEHPNAVAFTPQADKVFNAFFSRHDIPRGSVLSAQIKEIVQNQGYGPRCVDFPDLRAHRLHLLIEDRRPVDGSLLEAMVNPTTGEFYVKSTPPQRGAEYLEPNYYGPTNLAAGLSPGRRRLLLNRFENSGAPFGPTPPAFEGPVYRASLKDDGHVDGYAYAALIPLGGTTDVPSHTPDTARQFYVERSGGFAGRVEYAGPIDVTSSGTTSKTSSASALT